MKGQNKMTVAQLIGILKNIENKNLPVFIYNVETSDLHDISDIDYSLTDRVDINLGDKQ